jgi:homoserine dehydrogenase
VKLLGRAIRMEDGKIAAFVAPHLVPQSSPISHVEDVFNGVCIRGNAVGDVMFYGRGAGDLPTASAVMGDVLDVIDHRAKRRNLGWSQGAELAAIEEIPMKWYLRGEFDAAAVEEAEKIAEGAVITAPMTEIRAKAVAEKLGAAVMLRVL